MFRRPGRTFEHAIELRSVRKERPGERGVLRDLSLTVAPGSVCAVVGPPGSGKHLLLRAAAGRLRPDAGIVRVLGFDPVRDSRRLATRVGWVPDRATFPRGLCVREVGQLVRALCGAGDPLAFARVCATLDLSLTAIADRLTGTSARKLSLALALQKSPQVLLLDPPFFGEPRKERARVAELLRALRGTGLTILLAERQEEELAAISDRVVRIRRGRLVEFPAPAPAPRDEALEAVPAALPETRIPEPRP